MDYKYFTCFQHINCFPGKEYFNNIDKTLPQTGWADSMCCRSAHAPTNGGPVFPGTFLGHFWN